MKYLLVFILVSFIGCKEKPKQNAENKGEPIPDTVITAASTINLPEPYATASVKKNSKLIGWKDQKPTVPPGFEVTVFADSLDNPRWIYEGPNGDIFVAESNSLHSALEKITGQRNSADRITLFRDTNKDGKPETKSIFLSKLNKPFGMMILGNQFYVANTDAVVAFPYTAGINNINSRGKKIIALPGGPRHWTRNILAKADGAKIYIAIGSATDHAEKGTDDEKRRANIIEINPDGSGEKIFASGLRNPVGMAWGPDGKTLWTTVNERDELGDDLVPDYLTSVKENGFYGWPYSYFGGHKDPRIKDPRQDLVDRAIVPDISLGSHTASLGLAFYNQNSFPAKYKKGAFVAQHGSWNRSVLSGYKIIFVPFKNGKPNGEPEDFMTGFIANETSAEVYGRPVAVVVLSDGSLLVADDAGNTIWKIRATK